ncbi:MAG: hypothetical protein WDW36_003640 [Sanguina aurantia]
MFSRPRFMQLWDGVESDPNIRIVVMGATNRPWVVDEAVLRRFSMQYEIGLPDASQRLAILRAYVHKHEAEVPGAVCPSLLSSPHPQTHSLKLDTNLTMDSSPHTPLTTTSPAPANPAQTAATPTGRPGFTKTQQGLTRAPPQPAESGSAPGSKANGSSSNGTSNGSKDVSNGRSSGLSNGDHADVAGSSAAAAAGGAPKGLGGASTLQRGSTGHGIAQAKGGPPGGSSGSSSMRSAGDVDESSSAAVTHRDACDLAWVAAHTEGFSGSDLRELCSQVAQLVLGEMVVKEHRKMQQLLLSGGSAPASSEPLTTKSLRPMTRCDFEQVLQTSRPSTRKAEEYSSKSWKASGGRRGVAPSQAGAGNAMSQELMRFFMAMQQQPQDDESAADNGVDGLE